MSWKLLYGLAALFIAAYLVWPYTSLTRLYLGLKSADEEIVGGLVDWPSVRAGIRDDLNQIAADEINRIFSLAAAGSGAARRFNLSFSSISIADRIAREFARPAALIALFDDPRAVACVIRGLTSGAGAIFGAAAPPDCESVDAARGGAGPGGTRAVELQGPNFKRLFEKVNYVFFTGPFTFRLDVVHENIPVVLDFARQGAGWRLTRLGIPFRRLAGAEAAKP